MSESSQHYDAYMVHPDFGSEPVAGKLSVDRWRLFFQSELITWEIPLQQLEVKPGRGKDSRIYFKDRRHPGVNIFASDDSVFECASFVQSHYIRGQLQSVFGRRELVRRLRVTLYFFAGCAVVAWLASLVMGAMVHSLVNEIPMSWETQFGNSLMKKEESRLPFVDNSNAVAQLTALAQPLIRAIPAKNIRFQFHILDDDSPNAFALPGGHIIVTTGMLRLADRPDELLGVIAHETAHVTQRHAFRHLISGKGPIFILQVFMGGRNHLLEALAYPSEMLVYESFSQEYEREADSIGWSYLVAAHINPHGMIEIFRKLRKYDSAGGASERGSAFDSHPAMNRRIAWLEAKWKNLPDKSDFITLTNRIPKIKETDLNAKVDKFLRRR